MMYTNAVFDALVDPALMGAMVGSLATAPFALRLLTWGGRKIIGSLP